MIIQDSASLSLIGWCLILVSLTLTFIQNSLPNSAAGGVNRAMEATASRLIDWFEENREQRFVTVGIGVIAAAGALYYAELLPTFVLNIINVLLGLAMNLANRVQVWVVWEALAFAGAVGITIYLPLLIFLWLSRLHPGGAIGVVGLCFQAPDIWRDIWLVAT